MSEIQKILSRIPLPEVVRVHQKFDDLALKDPGDKLTALLNEKHPDILPGQRIAITCGSRGIDQYVTLVKSTVDYVKSRGALPVLIPSMGSHGGATPEGQAALVRHYGITEEFMGAPILSSMEVVEIGISKSGLPVYVDKNAYECDGIILLNRVKCHTAFHGPVESGLMKMLAIGLAKQRGAEMTHLLGFEKMSENIMAIGQVMLDKLNIVCGIGSVEDAFGHLAEIHVLSSEEIPEKEPEILKRANALMPRFYVDEADVLVMMKMGKEISGSGLDSNLTGRYNVPDISGGPKFRTLCVMDLSDESEGNANGMGQADFAPRSFYEKIIPEKAYINALTSTALYTAKMPMILDTDKQVLQAAVKFSNKPDQTTASVIIGVSTHEMGELYMSRSALDLIPEQFRDKVEIVGEFTSIPFDENGKLLLFR